MYVLYTTYLARGTVHVFRFSKKIFVFDVDVHLGILKMFPRTDISVRLYIYKEFRTKIEIFQFHSALHSRESFNLEKPIFSIIFHILQEKAIKSFGKVSLFYQYTVAFFLPGV